MATLENITISEFKALLSHARLPASARVTVTFEDQSVFETIKKKRAAEAMKKLRGSGNGNLVNALLKEREKDKLR